MLLVCLIWGGNFTVTKLAFALLSPLAFTAIRFAIGAALLLLLVRAIEGPQPWPRGQQLWRLIWLGVVGNTLYQLGFVFGLVRSTATNTSLIISASPAAVAVIGTLLGVERTTRRGRIGIALGILGVAVIVLARAGGPSHLAAATGDLFTVSAVLSWSIFTLGLRSLEGLSPLRITAWTTLTGTPGIVLCALPELMTTDLTSLGGRAWAALAYSIVFSLVIGYLLWNRSVRAVGATRTAIYLCVTPVVALAIAWIWLGERATWLHAVGGAAIGAGVVMTRLGVVRASPLEARRSSH